MYNEMLLRELLTILSKLSLISYVCVWGGGGGGGAGVGGGGLCRMSIIRYGNVAVLNLRKPHVACH